MINSEAFVARIKNAQINEDHELMSFDVKSLFTSIPLDLAIESVKEALANHSSDPPIPKEEVIDLLTLCLQSNFFQYDGNFYQQLHSTVMGSPVSVVVAEIEMQRLEEKALATYPDPPSFWYRYVDDTLTSLKKSEKIDFLNHLNRHNPSIQFTIEPEKDGAIAFLDCLVCTRFSNSVQTSVYRKPTSTDRLLDNSSYHPASHKSSTIKTLVKKSAYDLQFKRQPRI